MRGPFEDASRDYVKYIKGPKRDAVEVRAKMKQVRDLDNLLAAAKARIAGIESRIGNNVMALALTRRNTICAEVVKHLPSEIRTQIYSDCIGLLDEYDKCDLDSEDDGFRQTRFTNRFTLSRRSSTVPLINYWVKEYPDKGSREAMEEWLGETFASEMVAVRLSPETSLFNELSINQ